MRNSKPLPDNDLTMAKNYAQILRQMVSCAICLPAPQRTGAVDFQPGAGKMRGSITMYGPGPGFSARSLHFHPFFAWRSFGWQRLRLGRLST